MAFGPTPPAAQPPPAQSSPDPDPSGLGRLPRSALLWGRAAAVLLTVFLVYQLLLILKGLAAALLVVLICALLATIISFLGTPASDQLERRFRIPRTFAVLLTMVVGFGLLGLIFWLVSGPLVSEGRGLAVQAPSLVRRVEYLVTQIQHQLKGHGIKVDAAGFVTSKLTSVVPQLTGLAVTGFTTAVGIVVDIVISVVLSFWLMRDGRQLRERFIALFPTRVAKDLGFGIDAYSVVVGGYVRAQLFLAVVVGTMAGVGTFLLGVPFPLVVALAAGVFELIPLVGPFAGGAVALLLALTKSPTLAVFTLVLFLGIHVVEGYLLVPRVQARFVQLHPVVTLLALFAGVEVGGFLGALVAVPAASYVTVLIRAGVGDWRAQRPDLFGASRPDSLGDLRNRRLLRSFRIRRPAREAQVADGGPQPPGPPP
ncbi:MAG: AI-2E family transporter [Candidatus Dormibacteria bacterium]